MRVGDEKAVDEVVLLHRGGELPAATTILCSIIRQRLALDVAAVRDHHHHVLRRDQILVQQVFGMNHDFRAAAVATLLDVLGANLGQLLTNDLGDPHRRTGCRADPR